MGPRRCCALASARPAQAGAPVSCPRPALPRHVPPDGPPPIGPSGDTDMTTRRGFLPLAFAFLLAVAPAGFGQCFSTFNDDGFDTGCCGPAVPNLPTFPAATVTSDYGALFGCQQTFVIAPFQVTFSQPQWVLCDYALINVFVQLTPND